MANAPAEAAPSFRKSRLEILFVIEFSSVRSSVISDQISFTLITEHLLLITFFSLPSHTVDHVKKQERHQCKGQDEEEGTNIPQVRDGGITEIRNGRNRGEHLLIGQAVNKSAS
jgi:hypothetical protein